MDYFSRINRLSGSQQSARVPSALRDGFIHLDDRSLSDLIRGLSAYARLIRFYDLNNLPAGDWRKLFTQSELLVVAEASEIDYLRMKQHYRKAVGRGVGDGVDAVLHTLQIIAEWLQASESFRCEDGRRLALRVKQYAGQSLFPVMGAYAKLALEVDEHHRSALKSVCIRLFDSPSLTVKKPARSRQQRLALLNTTFDKVLSLRQFLAAECKTLCATLMNNRQHDPAVALLIAFIDVYRQSQEKFNRIPAKLLSYYYTQVLANVPESGYRDRIFIHCRTTRDTATYIPQGRRFIAGKTPDFQNIVYETETSNLITGARLESLQTVYLQRQEKKFPENATRAVTRIKHGLLPTDGEKIPAGAPGVFGCDPISAQSPMTVDAEFGLCIQSDHLLAGQGERHFELTVEVIDRTLRRLSVAATSDVCSDVHRRFASLVDGQQKTAGDIYSAMSEKIRAEADLVGLLTQFFLSGTAERSLATEEDAIAPLRPLLRACFIYLYMHSDNVQLVGKVHREIHIRRIFFAGYISPEQCTELRQRVADLQKQRRVLAARNQLSETQFDLIMKDCDADLQLSDKAILYKYLSDAFVFHLSSEQGWLRLTDYGVSRSGEYGGVCFTLKLDHSAPAIIAPELKMHGIACVSPVLKLLNNTSAPVYPYSFLRGVAVGQCRLRMKVFGYQKLMVVNDYGKVDISKPFLPFSAVPTPQSRLRIGGYEFARKRLERLTIHCYWRNLPSVFGGFAEYYRAYGRGYETANYTVNVQMLVGGELIPRDAGEVLSSALFREEPGTGKLLAYSQIPFPLAFTQPLIPAQLSEKEYQQNTAAQSGFVNLKLQSTGALFGHDVYNQVLSETLIHNSRSKRKKPLPAPPYTPELDRVTVDYVAQQDVCFIDDLAQLADSASRNLPHALAYYITPMGAERSYTLVTEGGFTLLPEWLDDGNVYLGYRHAGPPDSLNVYFQLKADNADLDGIEVSPVRWFYYARSGWKAMPDSAVLSDSTNGFRRSGIVRLRLLEDRAVHPGFGAGDQFWLKASASKNVASYGSLSGVLLDAITLRAVDPHRKLNLFPAVSDFPGISEKWQATPALAGITAYQQYEPAVDQSDQETGQLASLRLNERLRHRNRAVTPWDIERLVLQRFALVDRVKCLPACRLGHPGPVAGTVSVVVTPKLMDRDNLHSHGYHVNSVLLSEIQQFLRSVCAPQLTIIVANAQYEIVRVRCSVSFFDKVGSGLRVQQLSQDISRYLSPWTDDGLLQGLGWRIRTKDVERFIRQRDYVRFVTRVSLVKIYRDQEKKEVYRLRDTAHQPALPTGNDIDRFYLQAAFPWTLPVPAEKHDIALLEGDSHELPAEGVGINTMDIGGTFVLREGDAHA